MFYGVSLFLMLSLPVFGQENRTSSTNRFIADATILPAKLKLEGDSIRFTIKGTIPVESVLIPRNPRLELTLYSNGGAMELGDLPIVKQVANFSYEKKFSIKYEAWMQGAILELEFFQGKKGASTPSESKVLAKGIISPQLMVKFGAFYPNEPIPQVGLFQMTAGTNRAIENREEFSLIFNPGTSVLKPGIENLDTYKKIEEFIRKNPSVLQVKITGIQSPEQAEGRNSQLGNKRAQVVQKDLLQKFPEIPSTTLTMDSRWNDWFDLRLLLKDYQGISTQKKDELYSILLAEESFLEKREKLRKIAEYPQLSNDLFPKLRSAKVEIIAKPTNGLNFEQSNRLKESIASNSGVNRLSFAEWALAAESTQSLEEKAVIYSKMTEFYRSPIPYNNMAVVRMRQAQRTLDPGSKQVLWDEAERLLQQAYRIEPNAYSLHNQGQILALKGEYWEAYKKLSEASVLSKNPDFIQANEMLRGALDVQRGDYKLATLRFDYSIDDPKDLFNKGLAYYMLGDYTKATQAFEESVIRGREFGFGYYGLAMIAIQSGQAEIAAIQLKKAISYNSSLLEKLVTDPIFEELVRDPVYLNELKLK
jgi:tetratricopeptide (TPR) repeat protein